MRRRDEKFPDNGFEGWGGYMNAKIAKLEEQFSSRTESQLSNIFNGVSIYVNGYTNPSADELKVLMSQHGGVYHTYQRSGDYVIASNLPDTKVKNMSLTKVVTPEWIMDSIAAKRLLDYRNYLLYTNSRTQPRLQFNKVIKTDCTVLESKNVAVKSESEINREQSQKLDAIIHTESDISAVQNLHNVIKEKPDHLNMNDHSTKTAADPKFISEFYNNSRLHHISQLGACFKQHVNDLRENSDFVFPARDILKENIKTLNTNKNLSTITFEKGKTIMHIDMDCFFVSVGLRNKPELRGKPIAVTHSKGGQARPKGSGVDRTIEFNLYKEKQAKILRKVNGTSEDIKVVTRVDNITDEDDKFGSMSEIASCSYEARAKGISNGMFMGAALRLCPDLQTIPYDFEGYKEVAYTLYNTVAQYTLDIEAVSCDEMYVDCTELTKDMGVSVQDFSTALRNEIKNKTGCPCSTGFGGNRLQARLATKRAKPDGQFFLSAEIVKDFMYDINLKDLPGVGRQTAQKLESLGHQTCGSLQSLSITTLQHYLGQKTGTQLFNQCRGCDENPLTFHTVRKSVSAEVNYGIRFENNDQCIQFLKQLSAEVLSRMQLFKVLGKCITLKLMVRAEEAPVETAKFMGHGFCNVINKSITLHSATNDLEVITREVLSLCKKQKIDPKEMRGIGIHISKLELLNTKQIKGGINKFLYDNPNNKSKTLLKQEICNKLALPTEKDICKENVNVKCKQTTVIKTNSYPRKKLPILELVKSPGKKRGRPSKNLKARPSGTNNSISKYLQGQNVTRDTPYRNPIVKKEENVRETKNEEKKEGLHGLSWEKVRELLRAWLESGQKPLPCDITLVTEYMHEMVVNKNIDKLNILINFLTRRTREMQCIEWSDMCNQVIDEVQNAMLAVYGKRLYIEDY